MLEFVITVAMILLFATIFIIFTPFNVAPITNIILGIALYIFISKDIKDNNMSKYYALALVFTAFVFIFSDYGIYSTFFRVMEYSLNLSKLIIALLLIHVIANIIMYILDFYGEIKKKKK